MADRVDAVVVHTIHGPLDRKTAPFYRRHGHKATLVAISGSQARQRAGLRTDQPGGSQPDRGRALAAREQKKDYLLWVGRMDPVKGAHRAIEAARLAGRTLVLAGPVQTGQENYFREWIEPHVDDRRVHYVGEVAGTAKQELFANAAALLMPIRWREPFGMVMVEALACGTPVIAFPEGAAAEIVIDGENGMLVADEAEMARAIHRRTQSIPTLPIGRRRALRRTATAAGYERVYRDAIDPGRRHGISPHPERCSSDTRPWHNRRAHADEHPAVQRRAERKRSPSAGDRDPTRVLTLLETNQAAALTIAALRERGVDTPAQAVYELQLAGYEIDRVVCEHPNGHATLGYRLRAAPVPAIASARLKEVANDEISR